LPKSKNSIRDFEGKKGRMRSKSVTVFIFIAFQKLFSYNEKVRGNLIKKEKK